MSHARRRPTGFGMNPRVVAPAVRSALLPAALLLFLLAVAPSKGTAAPSAGSDGVATLRRAVAPARVLAAADPAQTRLDRIVVKFVEGSTIRMRAGHVVSLSGSVPLTDLDRWLAAHPQVTVVRHFARDEAALDAARASGLARSGVELADLNLYYQFRLPGDVAPATLEAMLHELRAFSFVETAFVEPLAFPPVIVDPRAPAAEAPRRDGPGLPTPNYTAQQGYLYAPPSGINAQAVWGFSGGRGATVKVIDVEGAWLFTHEDLKAPFFEGGTQINDLGWRNHGTAVMGEMVGGNNAFGVTGIAADLQVGGCSVGSMSVAAAFDLASANLAVGDLFLVELHAPGPNANGSGQYGYVPMEYWQDNFDAIQTAVANGRICVEAGGNGEQNLDDAVYQNLFNRDFRYSGAILVGAGTPTGNDAEWFTNYGSRIDLNGWGSSVVTSGYGDLQGGAETQWYTSYFSGTSSASPIVTGSVACLQGMCRAEWNMNLNGPLAMKLLYDSGTQWNGTKRIGRRPNLLAARALLLQGIGTASGHVRDAETQQVLAGVKIDFPNDDIFVESDGGGQYQVTLQAGSHPFEATDFFHFPLQDVLTLSGGQQLQHDLLMQPRPHGNLAGTFLSQATGLPIAGGVAAILNTPIAPSSGGISTHYQINGIPEGNGYQAVFGLIAGYGAAAATVNITAGQTLIVDPILPTAQTFETTSGGYTGDAPWEWGTPSLVGPGGAFSGAKLWATNLSGNYGDNVTAYLTMPAQNFSGATSLRLSFTHWYDIEAGFDGGNVQVQVGSNWVTVEPVGGYPMIALSGLGSQSGYSGASGGWKPAVFDLTPYISSAVRVRFHFGSDPGVNGAGWYFDDVAFDLGTIPSAAPEPGAAAQNRWSIQPNPFRETVRFGIQGATGPIVARLFDPAGRQVRELSVVSESAGTQGFLWDGRDAEGHRLPAGAYLCRLESQGHLIGSQRIIKIR